MIFNKLITKLSRCLCSIVLLVAPITTYSCRLFLNQPEEPMGLEEFLLQHRKNN